MDRGINELFEGPTITNGGHKYILPPSSFAEAELGLMTRNEIELGLEEVVEQVTNDGVIEAPAIRWAIERAQKKGKQTVGLEDVMERVKVHHEKRGKLITHTAVRQERITGGGVLSFDIERRGDSRKGKVRLRDVNIEIDAAGKIIQYSCNCETYDKNFVKGNYDPLSKEETDQNGARMKRLTMPGRQGRDVSGFPVFTTHVACYHIAAGLLQTSRTTGLYTPDFKFTKVAIFEALFMDVFRRIKEATIDDYLIRQGTITDELLGQISEGKLTLEVLKHSKNIDMRSKEIIGGVRMAREKDGYMFSGFATDFRETPFQTTSVVLTKNDGRSVHLLYDGRFGIELPFMMLNIPFFLWLNMGRAIPATAPQGNPIKEANKYFKRFDTRTQQEIVSIVTTPDRHLITQEEGRLYERAMRTEMAAQPKLA